MKRFLNILVVLLFFSSYIIAQETTTPVYAVGDTVIVNPSTTHYMTGERISKWVYNVKHIIRQIGSFYHKDGILLKGIKSWVQPNDVMPAGPTIVSDSKQVTEVQQPQLTEENKSLEKERTIQKESTPIEKIISTKDSVKPTEEIRLVEEMNTRDTLLSHQTTSSGVTRLKGRLVSKDNQAAINGATIILANQNISTTTNQAGEFSLLYLEPMDEEVIIEAQGYISTIELVVIEEGKTTEMPDIQLQQDIASEAQEEVLLNLSETELNDDEGKSQSQASASSASQDVFNSTTSWAWSTARYRNRGYEQTFEQNYINGISFNSAERGQFNFSAMGGLNDATRYKEVVNPIEATNFTFGGFGNATNYLQSATNYAQGWKIGVAGTNRNYKARANITYASGLLNNGWAFVGQIAYRFSPYIDNKGIIGEGIEYHSLGYFFSAEKNWNNTKRLSIITFGAPTMRGQSGAVTQEVYDLTGSINYNPYWGYQDGKVRNSRVVKSFDPTAIVSFDWKINDDNKIKFAVGYHYSLYSNSALTFYNAPDPRPDYYRNLPSFLWDGQIVASSSKQLYDLMGEDPSGLHYGYGNFIGANLNGRPLGEGFVGADGTNLGPSIDARSYNDLVRLWQTRDNKTTQIDWDGIYAANYANNTLNPESSARYMVERRHNDIQEGMATVNFQNTKFDHLKITAGLELKESQGLHYKTVDDLLGGNQWIDVDPFADRDIKELATNISMSQSEINYVTQNNIKAWNENGGKAKNVTKGNVFGYDYQIYMTNAKIWAQNEWNWQNVDFYYALQLSYSSMMRSTNMINGRALYLASINPAEAQLYLGPKNDYLKILQGQCPAYMHGAWHHFVDPSFKIGANYKINGRNKLKINAIAQTTSPLARDAYISPRVHDRAIANIYTHDNAKTLGEYYSASQKMVGGDITYEFNYPFVRGRITGFYSRFWNGTELNGFYDDETRTFVNQSMTGINRRHCGIEAAAAFKLGTYFTLTPALSVGDYRYTDNAYCVTSAENGMSLAEDINGNPIYETRDKVLIKGLRVATGPQVNTSLKLSFFHPKMWFADVTVSYYDWNYLDFAPSRRMQGLYTGTREDNTVVNGSYLSANAIEKDQNGEIVCDDYGTPKLVYPYNLMADQESLSATNPLNRFLIDASIGKLIYLPNRQSLSINLNVTNLTNNTHFKTGGYQQARLPRATKQGETDKTQNSVITANAWKFPSKYYYAWGTNFYLTLTYKF